MTPRRSPWMSWMCLAVLGSACDASVQGDTEALDAELTSCSALSAPVFQRINPRTGDALVTVSKNEADRAVSLGYTQDDGIVFYASSTPATGLVGARRLRNPTTQEHLWVTSTGERSSAATRYGFTVDEGIGFYVAPRSTDCGAAVYRLYGPSVRKHRFAAQESVRQALVKSGWTDEGISFFAGQQNPESPIPSKPSTPTPSPSRPTGADTVRYEDLYRSGMTLQQVVEAAGARTLTFPEGTFEFSDFKYNGAGLDLPSRLKGIIGSGRGTIFQMKAHTSTKRAPTTGTNPYVLIRYSDAVRPLLKNFTLRGTDQGHSYGGIVFRQCDSPTADNLYLRGASPGYSNFPPGETFGINFFRSPHGLLKDTEVDGRDLSGKRVSSSPFGWNSTEDATVRGGYFHHALAGMPTFWQTDGVTTYDLRSEYNGSGSGSLSGHGINHERSTHITHYNPRLLIDRQHGNGGTHVSMQNDQQDGVIRIVNPSWDNPGIVSGRFLIMTGAGYASGQQRQKTAPVVVDAQGKPVNFYWAH